MPLLGFWKKKEDAQPEQTFSLPPPSLVPDTRDSSDPFSAQSAAQSADALNTSETLDLDKPPKPPEFDITGPDFPSDDEIPPLEVPKGDKPIHIDDLSAPPAEAPLELPALGQPEQEAKAAAVSDTIPETLPEIEPVKDTLQPLDHEIYQGPQVEKPKPMPQPGKRIRYKARPESVQLEPGPLFINMEGYKQILGTIVHMTGKLREAEGRIAGMASDRSKEDALYMKFQTTIDQAERKLMTVDETLFGGKQYGGE